MLICETRRQRRIRCVAPSDLPTFHPSTSSRIPYGASIKVIHPSTTKRLGDEMRILCVRGTRMNTDSVLGSGSPPPRRVLKKLKKLFVGGCGAWLLTLPLSRYSGVGPHPTTPTNPIIRHGFLSRGAKTCRNVRRTNMTTMRIRDGWRMGKGGEMWVGVACLLSGEHGELC